MVNRRPEQTRSGEGGRPEVQALGQRIIAKRARALERLANHDRGEQVADQGQEEPRAVG